MVTKRAFTLRILPEVVEGTGKLQKHSILKEHDEKDHTNIEHRIDMTKTMRIEIQESLMDKQAEKNTKWVAFVKTQGASTIRRTRGK